MVEEINKNFLEKNPYKSEEFSNKEIKEQINDNINKINKEIKDKVEIKKLPKIILKQKSNTEISGKLTTSISEPLLIRKESKFPFILKKNIFLKPNIKNDHYNTVKKMDYSFKKKSLEKKLKMIESLKAKNELSPEEIEIVIKHELLQKKEQTKLTNLEIHKYLDLYNCKEMEVDSMDLKETAHIKDYRSIDFGQTKYANFESFNVFYKKVHKNNEIIRKGGQNIKTPSFNLIRATTNFRVVPNAIGVVKRKGDYSILDLKNKGLGDNYVNCLSKSFSVNGHITEVNLSNNRLSDLSLIPLFKSIMNNQILLKKLVRIDLSYNKIGSEGTDLLCKLISEYDCNLEYLNLEGNNLGVNNGRKIIETSSKFLNTKIKYLNLGQNNLNDDISMELSSLIKRSEFLNVLILYQNQFRNLGAGLMMNEIKNHCRLKILDLSWNLIGTNLTEEIPTLDQLKKSNKNQKGNYYNAYLDELKLSPQPRKIGTLSPIVKENKVSFFTTQLCELFHNKNNELIHLDISYNNLNAFDGKAISEHIKDNHTILGIHVDGNNMWVDELGFVFPIEKSKYKRNHFANSQIFYRLDKDHPLSRSRIINVQKLRSKNNCWICEGWREIKYNYRPNNYVGNLETSYVKIHLNFEGYKPYELNYSKDSFICYRMCPPGILNYFLTINGIPVDNYGSITQEIREPIIYIQELKKIDNESNNDNSDEEEEIEPKKFIITKLAQINVEINQEVISSSGYTKNLKHCVPRPEKNLNLQKKSRIPWTFPISLWAWYGYEYKGEPESVYNDAFEFDYNRCNFEKDKDLLKEEESELKSILKEKYMKIVDTYKNLSSYLGWKIWQIGKNQITEFASSCTDLLDSKYLINDVLVKVTEVKSNIVDKQESKKNKNIPDNIIRHQFLMLLVKLAKDKYFRTKQIESIPKCVSYAFEHNYNSYINQFDNHKWRIERYYNEKVDNVLKAYIPVFDALFYCYAPQQIIGRKDSFWMTLENYTNLCSNLMDSDFPVKEIPVLFNLSMRLQTNEINFDKHYNMTFPEFLEAISRFIDKLSPLPPGEDKFLWDMKKRQEQDLYIKIESIIPKIMNLLVAPYKNVKDKFVIPPRDKETGLLIIDYENPFYEGKLPRKKEGKKIIK